MNRLSFFLCISIVSICGAMENLTLMVPLDKPSRQARVMATIQRKFQSKLSGNGLVVDGILHISLKCSEQELIAKLSKKKWFNVVNIAKQNLVLAPEDSSGEVRNQCEQVSNAMQVFIREPEPEPRWVFVVELNKQLSREQVLRETREACGPIMAYINGKKLYVSVESSKEDLVQKLRSKPWFLQETLYIDPLIPMAGK